MKITRIVLFAVTRKVMSLRGVKAGAEAASKARQAHNAAISRDTLEHYFLG